MRAERARRLWRLILGLVPRPLKSLVAHPPSPRSKLYHLAECSAVPFSDAEIRALFKSPDEGITTQAITKKNGWGSRLRIPEVKAAFVTSLKRMTITGKDKIIRLRDEYK